MEDTPFGRYRLVELLGRGGMGEVWRAFDTATERVVAIKLLPPHLANDDAFIERFRREARIAASLEEPHIVPIYDFGEIDDRLYVSMRLIKGRDLNVMLANGPLPAPRAVNVITQVASALNAAHETGLVHRDVKPSNVLVSNDDFTYLIDFGIARGVNESSLTSSGMVVGTWSYMAPERLNSGIADARADVYALACVLHEVLTGQRPFPGDSLEQQVVGHLTTPPPRPSMLRQTVPQRMDAVIAAGMAKDPSQRYSSTKELAQAARAALYLPKPPPERPSPPEQQVRPPSPPPTTPRPTRSPAPQPVASTKWEGGRPSTLADEWTGAAENSGEVNPAAITHARAIEDSAAVESGQNSVALASGENSVVVDSRESSVAVGEGENAVAVEPGEVDSGGDNPAPVTYASLDFDLVPSLRRTWWPPSKAVMITALIVCLVAIVVTAVLLSQGGSSDVETTVDTQTTPTTSAAATTSSAPPPRTTPTSVPPPPPPPPVAPAAPPPPAPVVTPQFTPSAPEPAEPAPSPRRTSERNAPEINATREPPLGKADPRDNYRCSYELFTPNAPSC